MFCLKCTKSSVCPSNIWFDRCVVNNWWQKFDIHTHLNVRLKTSTRSMWWFISLGRVGSLSSTFVCKNIFAQSSSFFHKSLVSYVHWLLLDSFSILTEDLPDHNCTNPLDVASSCHHYLPWTQTSSSLHIQSLLSGDTENLLASLSASQCYNMSQMFVCATRYPACQANGFPLLPCRHVCERKFFHISRGQK